MADLLAAAQSYLKRSDSQILSPLMFAVSDPLPSSLLKAFQQSNEYYGNLLQQMRALNCEINDHHGFQLVSPGGPSLISTQTLHAEYHHQSAAKSDEHSSSDEAIDEELVRSLDRDISILFSSNDEEMYLASDEEDEFQDMDALEESLDTLSCECSDDDDSASFGPHDEFSVSAGWWISAEYFQDDPSAVFIGHEPEFVFRFNEKALSSGPDCVHSSDEDGFFSSGYFD